MAQRLQTSNIQSKIQEAVNAKQQQAASSSAATQSGSTTTPTVTATPKVTQTAKAVPSVTRPEITPVSTATINTASTVNARDLLWSKATPTLRQASQDLLSPATEKKDIQKTTIPLNIVKTAINMWWKVANTVAESLYDQGLDWINEKFGKLEEKRQSINQAVWSIAIDMFKWVGQDISNQWTSWEWIWMVRDAVANIAEWLPRGITRIEYWLAEMLDRASDAKWVNDLKSNIESNLDYWENTRVYKKLSETSSFSDFLKNPLMYAWGTFTEMLPMFISAWVAVPTTYAQMYWDAYRDYANDESLQGLTDNQIRLMATWVAWVNTIIELWADLIQSIMPWTKTAAKTGEREVRRVLSKPFSNLIKKLVKWWASEWVEEVLQNEIQDQVAWAMGSDRDMPTWWSRLTTFWIAAGIWSILQWWNIVIDINKHKELHAAFNEWSEAVDKIAPWVSKSDKEKFFSAIVAAEIQDANMSEKRVNKYETQTTELYNRIDELNKELETTTNENRKLEINRQIEDANQKIKDIDEIINKGNAIMEEVNQKLQELSQQEVVSPQEETQLPREEWGENFSEQTMVDNAVTESKPIDQMTDDEIVRALNYWTNNKPQTPQERQRLKNISNELDIRLANATLTEEEKQWLADLSLDINSIPFSKIAKAIVELDILALKEKDEEKRKWYEELEKKLKNRVDEANKLSEQDTEKRDAESLLPWTEIDSNLFYENWRKRTWWDVDDYSMAIFRQDRQHIPWLKWVKVWWLENLTDADIMEMAKNAADIAWILGIDFNKILDNAQFSVLNLKWQSPRWTENINWRQYTRYNSYRPDILELSIILKDTWPSVFWHELMHLLDKEYLYRNWKLFTPSGNLTRSSMIKATNFKTYKNVGNDEYWDSSREILARYAEQYVAYKVDKWEYKKYTDKSKYWSDAEFKKLIPQFESLIDRNFSEFRLDEWDRKEYPEIMKKMQELQYQQSQFTTGEESEMLYKLIQMKQDYDTIVNDIENIKNDTIRLELETETSALYSNYEMLNKMKEDYIEKQKITPQQQEDIDTTTTTVVPDPPQNPETIMLWLPYYWWSNIEEWIGKITEWESWNEDFEKSYMTETERVKMNKRNKKIKWFFKELHQTWKDIITPSISRIYNISPRVAWRLITMETQKDINIHRYRKQAEWFVNTLWSLKWKQALEVKMALLDYWALASEQTEDTIAEYKKQEVAKLKEVLLRNGFKEKDINDMFKVLDDIWQQYKDAWLSITLTDMYFPRVVKDYEWLIDYMSRKSGRDIQANKTSLMIRIRQIQQDTNMSNEEKEARIRRIISTEFNQPWTTSQHGKERKMWLLSDWWPWIFAYYESPIESIDHYITTMVNAVERQLFLGWLKEDANIDADIINQDTAESVSQIIWKLVENWQVNEDDVAELQKSIMAVLNKKPSPKSVTAIKDVTYIATITNFLSAINQLDDLWMVILRDRSWLKHIVKAVFGRANIKYDDLWLEDAYEMFREEWGVTNWLFKKSLFNTFDRLWKTSFINTAWESMVRQAKNENTRKYLYTRLQSMYWTESADRMMEKIDSWNYNDETGQIDIEILRDLLYQLWSTQPLYTSAMPTTYLNHPRTRLAYALSSFTLKRIDWLVQWTKEVYKQHWAVAAWAWVMWVSSFLAMFWAAIWDVWDLLKWDKEETFLWKWINEWIDEALKSAWGDALDSWLKIWDLSEYDIKTYKQQWLRWVFASKIKPFIFDLGKDVQQAVAKRDMNEITDLAKYVPIFWKLVYYWLWDDLESSTKSEKKSEWNWSESIDWDWWEVDNWNWESEEERDWS